MPELGRAKPEILRDAKLILSAWIAGGAVSSLPDLIAYEIERVIEEERASCAQIADKWDMGMLGDPQSLTASSIAEEIRSRNA